MRTEDIMPKGKRTFTPKEVAIILEHDASTVTRWCNDGTIEASKPVGRWRIARESVERLLEQFGIL